MKKILIICIALSYLAFNAGVLINFHFCGTTFHHFTVIIEPKDCCGGENLCCHNKSFELKISGEYDNVINPQVVADVQFEIRPSVAHGNALVLSHNLRQEETFHLPGPLIQACKYPLYLTNRVIII